MSSSGQLQAAATIAKTTQTLVGFEIKTENAKKVTLFLTYTKGDETGLDIILNKRKVSGGTNHPNLVWTQTGGVYTGAAEKIRLTATGNYTYTWDIEGCDFIAFTQGGSNNDGTPTGTLAAHYCLSQELR